MYKEDTLYICVCMFYTHTHTENTCSCKEENHEIPSRYSVMWCGVRLSQASVYPSAGLTHH